MQKRIYINTTFLCSRELTGIARFAIVLLSELKKLLGHDLVFLAPYSVFHPEICQTLDVKKIGVNSNRVLWEQIDLPLYLSLKNKPLLLSIGNTAPLFYDNQIVSILDIFYQRENTILKKNKENLNLTANFFKLTTPIIIENSKIVLTISEYSKSDIVDFYKISSDKVAVVYPSLSNEFTNVHQDMERNEYGKYILAVSAITPRKNFEGVIKAYIQAKFTDVKLVIVGGFETTSQNYNLTELYRNNSNIVFTGYIDNNRLVNLYQNALFFVYPSFLEGFGIPPLEAMACGCPTLVSDVTSLPEACGDASLYVDPYSIESITQGMIILATDKNLRQDLILKGFEQIKKFSVNNSVCELIKLITKFV